MSIARHAEAIIDCLRDWATQDGGKAFVASDLVHMWELASQQTQGPRAILCYDGETLRGDFSVAAALGRVDRAWQLAIVRGRGFNAVRGDSLVKTVGNARPFYDLVEEARDIIRAMVGVSVELPVDYRTTEPMLMGDTLLDAYIIKFSTAIDLPTFETGDEDTITETGGTPRIVIASGIYLTDVCSLPPPLTGPTFDSINGGCNRSDRAETPVGNYPSLAATWAAPISNTLDSIAIPPGLRLQVWDEENYAGNLVLDVEGPAVIYNDNAALHTPPYDYALTGTWSDETLEATYPASVRSVAATAMSTWESGSLKITLTT